MCHVSLCYINHNLEWQLLMTYATRNSSVSIIQREIVTVWILVELLQLHACLHSNNVKPTTRQCGHSGCCRWVKGEMENAACRLWNLIKHIVLPESKQRCTWQQLTATTKEVRKSLWLSNTPHCRKSLSMGFWEDILQLVTVTEAEITWHNWNSLANCRLFNVFSSF